MRGGVDLILSLALAACATGGEAPGSGDIAWRRRSKGQALTGANCVVHTGAGNWTVATPGPLLWAVQAVICMSCVISPVTALRNVIYRPSSGGYRVMRPERLALVAAVEMSAWASAWLSNVLGGGACTGTYQCGNDAAMMLRPALMRLGALLQLRNNIVTKGERVSPIFLVPSWCPTGCREDESSLNKINVKESIQRALSEREFRLTMRSVGG